MFPRAGFHCKLEKFVGTNGIKSEHGPRVYTTLPEVQMLEDTEGEGENVVDYKIGSYHTIDLKTN